MWTREKKKWNIFTTDPKGENLAKFYYPATIRGYEIVQFNLSHPHLTNSFNPLINALQAFRQNNPVKGTSLIDSVVDTLFPDNGEIWNPAAGNMFRRMVYLLFDYYIEQENYIRYVGHKNGTPQDVIDASINKNYEKVNLFNVYASIGELAAKVSKDTNFINVDPSVPPESEKDLLTVLFEAMSMLPTNTLRSKAITANNAIKQIAGAEQTISGIYATLLTGLSVYDDDTTKALMTGSINEAFDVSGLGFPRRIGVQFDDAYMEKFRLNEELCKWTVYRDRNFTDKYEGEDFEHVEKISTSNWVWGFFKGIFDQEDTFVKLTVYTSDGQTVAREFFFQFTKGYKIFDGITYVINPITKEKEVSGGTLIELDPQTKEPKVSEFTSKQVDVQKGAYHDVSNPIIASNQVFYSEKPKFIFAVTPPHLQVYQKHILIIIKQMLDETYSLSYATKRNRKPIVGTRMMLDEFGNIRSGDKGIPNIDTATSIALGQDVQLTFVLQSFQQLRAIYKEDVEKIIRSNSSNTIFLKSNDKELIDELVRMSGSKHQRQVDGRSFSRNPGDLIDLETQKFGYNEKYAETTTLTSNDLLFLAGPNPGNSITFSSGEMPIVNKLSTITPMAAGLHKHIPEPATGQYTDSTLPSTNHNDSVNMLENIIDGEALVHARVDQAHIWMNEIKPKFEEVVKREGLDIDERDEQVAKLVMNAIYEQYDKDAGQTRTDLAEPLVYWKVAAKLMEDAKTVSDTSLSSQDRMAAIGRMKENLVKCTMDPELDDLTKIYKDTVPTSSVNMGYNEKAITKFIMAFVKKYPKPKDLELEHRDIYEAAKANPNYKEYEGNQELLFDPLNTNHTLAFEQIVGNVVDGAVAGPKGLEVTENPNIKTPEENDTGYDVSVDGHVVMHYMASSDGTNYTDEWTVDNTELTKIISSNPAVVDAVQLEINDIQ